MKTRNTIKFLATIGLIAAAAMGGCRGDRTRERPRQFIPDMDDSPKFKPQTKTEFYADGRSMRQPVAGTVPFGDSPRAGDDRASFLKADDAFYTGKVNGAYLDKIPSSVNVDAALLERGQDRFNIYCAACHGFAGDGKGMIGQQWSYVLPNFHDVKYKDPKTDQGKDGYIFHTLRNGLNGPDGKNKMPPYGHAINENDAWAVVAYVRALQASQAGTLNDLSAAQQAALKASQAAEIEMQNKAATPPLPATPTTEKKQ